MATKKITQKKGGFSLVPIILSEPVKTTDGFTNLIAAPPEKTESAKSEKGSANAAADKTEKTTNGESKQTVETEEISENSQNENIRPGESTKRLAETELLRILDANHRDEI